MMVTMDGEKIILIPEVVQWENTGLQTKKALYKSEAIYIDELHSGVITGLRVRPGRQATPRQKLLNPHLSKDKEFYSGVIEVPGSWIGKVVIIILKD